MHMYKEALAGLEVFNLALNVSLANAGVPKQITEMGEGDPEDLPQHVLEEFGLDDLVTIVEVHTRLKDGVTTRRDYEGLVEAYEFLPQASKLMGFPYLSDKDFLQFEHGLQALDALMESYASKFDV